MHSIGTVIVFVKNVQYSSPYCQYRTGEGRRLFIPSASKGWTHFRHTPVAQEKKKIVTPEKVDKKENPIEKAPDVTSPTAPDENNGDIDSYKVRGKAFFHNEPDEATYRNAFIVHWNIAYCIR